MPLLIMFRCNHHIMISGHFLKSYSSGNDYSFFQFNVKMNEQLSVAKGVHSRGGSIIIAASASSVFFFFFFFAVGKKTTFGQ